MWMLVVWVVLSVIQYAMAKAAANRAKTASKGPGEIQAPIAEHGTPIAVAYGTTLVKGANVIKMWGAKAARESANHPWYYYANMDLAICWGPAKLLRVCSGEVWGTLTGAGYAGAGSSTYQSATIGFGSFSSEVNGVEGPFKIAALGMGDPSLPAGNVRRGVVMLTGSTVWMPDHFPIGTVAIFHANYDNAQSRAVGVDLYDNTDVVPVNGTVNPFDAALPNTPETMIEYYASSPLKKVGDLCYVTAAYNSDDGVSITPIVSPSWPLNTWYRWNGARWQPYLINPAFPVDSIDYTIKIGDKDTSSSVDIHGKALFYAGTQTQGADKNWKDSNGVGPNFPGLCHVVLYGERGTPSAPNGPFSWGMSASLPDLAFEVQRFPNGIGAPSIHGTINGSDANPALVLYDLLTNTNYGLGTPATKIDNQSFLDAAATLYAERIGISMLLDKQATFDSVAEDILKTIDGALFEDPQTGLWTLALARQDYDTGDLMRFTADDYLDAPEYQRSSWGDVANDVRVSYISRKDGYKNAQVMQQNPANMQRLGELVTVSNTYNAVTQADTAYLLAARDLRVLSHPLAKIKLKLNRRAWKLRPCSVFILDDAELGISGMAVRVVKISYGTPQDPGVTIEGCEDVFGTPSTTYSPPDTVDPVADTLPRSPSAVALWELPYYQTMGYYWPLDDKLVGVLAARGSDATYGLKVLTDDAASGIFEETGFPSGSSNGYSPYGLLSAALAIEERTASIQLQGAVDFDRITLDAQGNNFLLVGDEVMSFSSFGENDDGTVTLYNVLRGVLDTIPYPHPLGAPAWVVNAPMYANYPYSADGTHNVKAIAFNDVSEINAGTVEAVSITTNNRTPRPWVPGKFRVGTATTLEDSLEDAVLTGASSISWATRNRKTQMGAVAQDAAAIAMEAGEVTRVKLTSRLSELFVMVGPNGEALPSGVAVDVGPATVGAVAYRIQGCKWIGDVGLKDYPETVKTWGGSTAFDVIIPWFSPTGFGVATNGSIPSDAAYAFVTENIIVSNVGGRLKVTRTDTRPYFVPDTTFLQEDLATGTLAIGPEDFVGAMGADIEGVIPVEATVSAVRDGIESLKVRESGKLYQAGWGMNWGAFWGGH